MIEFGTQCRLNTAHLPERHCWRDYHGKVVTVIEQRHGNADTRAIGYYYVSFGDETFGHCFVDELEPIKPQAERLFEACCANEKRDMRGGCINCGDPCF